MRRTRRTFTQITIILCTQCYVFSIQKIGVESESEYNYDVEPLVMYSD